MSILSRLVLTKSVWNDIISGAIQVFSQRGFDAQRGPLRRGGGGRYGCILPENFKIPSPRKRDFRHSEAKTACFNISFFKVKMPFFLHQNITKLRKNDVKL